MASFSSVVDTPPSGRATRPHAPGCCSGSGAQTDGWDCRDPQCRMRVTVVSRADYCAGPYRYGCSAPRARPSRRHCHRHERMLNRCSTGQARVACWVGSLATNHMGPSLGATIPHAFPTTRSPRWRSATITPCQKPLASAERGGSSPLSDTREYGSD